MKHLLILTLLLAGCGKPFNTPDYGAVAEHNKKNYVLHHNCTVREQNPTTLVFDSVDNRVETVKGSLRFTCEYLDAPIYIDDDKNGYHWDGVTP